MRHLFSVPMTASTSAPRWMRQVLLVGAYICCALGRLRCAVCVGDVPLEPYWCGLLLPGEVDAPVPQQAELGLF